MKQIQRFVVGTVFAVLMSSGAWAEAPEIITYQGRIRDSGLPFTGVKSVEIWLHDCETGACGTALGTGAQNVSVVNGLFRTTFTVPSGVSLGTANWWLETRMDGGSVVFSPREKLGSAPYALMASTASAVKDGIVTSVKLASDAGSLAKVTGGAMAMSGGSVGIGTTDPGQKLEVNGAAKLTPGSAPTATEGSMYYDSTNHSVKISTADNSGAWLQVGPPTVCPAGMGLMGSGRSAYCIEMTYRTAQTYYDASMTCLNAGRYLCNFQEWSVACSQPLTGWDYNNTQWEWVADPAADGANDAVCVGNSGCLKSANGNGSHSFRCCQR
jgi:hypothetical protein